MVWNFPPTGWSYVFYKTEDEIASSCVTELFVAAEGAAGPSGSDWYRKFQNLHYSHLYPRLD